MEVEQASFAYCDARLPLPPATRAEYAWRSSNGVEEMLDLATIFEEQGIFCFLVGVCALVFYGAGRVRLEWEVAIPSEHMDKAVSLLRSDKLSTCYREVHERPFPQPQSLTHTYLRFAANHTFRCVLVPAEDVHLQCDESTIWRSHNGLPYPALPLFVQSVIDTWDSVALADVIDGADLTEEWGNEMLDLEGTYDWEWAKRMNIRVVDSFKHREEFPLTQYPTVPHSRREIWEGLVRTKEGRLGWKHPKELFNTRFRLKKYPADPWTVHRTSV